MEKNIQEDLINLSEENPVFAIKEIVEFHLAQKGAAIPILQDIQNIFGFVSPEMIRFASDFSGIPAAELYSIVTFYAQFRMEPIGKNFIQICHGTACHLAGAEKITESLQFETGARAGGTSEDGLFTIEKVACIGCCSLAPVMNLKAETYGRLTPDRVKKIIRDVRNNPSDNTDVKSESGGGCKDA